MLILYPDINADSFVTVAEADIIISELTLQSTAWLALTEDDREIYLRIAYRNILSGVDQTINPIPDPVTDCYGEAQSLMASHDVTYGISASTTVSNSQVKKQKIASLEIEYFEVDGVVKATSVVPDLAKPCLEEIGWVFDTDLGRLSQMTLGRS